MSKSTNNIDKRSKINMKEALMAESKNSSLQNLEMQNNSKNFFLTNKMNYCTPLSNVRNLKYSLLEGEF